LKKLAEKKILFTLKADKRNSTMTLRKWAYQLLEPSVSGSRAARAIEVLLISLIFLNIVAIILESVKSIEAEYRTFFHSLESFSVIIFTIEYILRLWTCVENPKYSHAIGGRLRYALTPMALIDLLSIIPFYIGFLDLDMRFIRIVRTFRLIRVLKIARYLKALNLIQAVLRERKEQIVLSVMFIVFLLVMVSTVMYYVEHDAQPEVFSSIPKTMWWGIETLTTVGYGDMIPQTTAGKILGGMIAVLGIGLFALPAGILSSGLTEHLHGSNKKKKRCPHCGEELPD
jgi:voltage-gated potassium channel